MKKHLKNKKLLFLVGAAALIFLLSFAFKLSDGAGRGLIKIEEKRIDYVPVTEYFSQTQDINFAEVKTQIYKKNVYVEQSERENLKKIFGDDINYALDYQNQDLVGKIAILKWSSVTPKVKTLSYEDKYLWNEAKDYKLYVTSEFGEEFAPEKVTKITALGDVMLSRHVNKKIQALGYDYPWQKVTEIISDADITFANLEVPLSDLFPPPTEGISFIAPVKNVAAIIKAGVNIVSVANNHSANFGRKVFEDNLLNLKNSGLEKCGGGENDAGARGVTIIEKNGVKFGFLCYNSIIGGQRAGANTSGIATVEIKPWYRDSANDIEKVKQDIKKAKEDVDVLLVSPHWGVEYRLNPNSSQTKLGREMIDAGADVILGTHPHVVQGAEIYKNKFIIYSLGNFIFDQEWSSETKEGIVIDSYFYGKNHVSSVMRPIQITNYSQPFFLGSAGNYILERIKSASIGF